MFQLDDKMRCIGMGDFQFVEIELADACLCVCVLYCAVKMHRDFMSFEIDCTHFNQIKR